MNRPKTQQVVKLKLWWVLFPGLAEVLVIDLGRVLRLHRNHLYRRRTAVIFNETTCDG